LGVLLLVAGVNLSVFGAGLGLLTRKMAADRLELARELAGFVEYTMRASIEPGGELNVAEILRWPYWRHFPDAVILGRAWTSDEAGDIQPQGVWLNPLGSGQREGDFPRQEVLRAIAAAADSGLSRAAAGGLALPIFPPGTPARDLLSHGERDGDDNLGAWGGCWFPYPSTVDRGELFTSLLPAFLFSTLLMTWVTFTGLRRFVLSPVQALAGTARRVSDGDFSARVKPPRLHGEIASLMGTFNSMAERIEGHDAALQAEVRRATAQARAAEAAAMTQRRLAATGELAAGIAHEINNPLGGLLNAVEALDTGQVEGEGRRRYHALLRSGLERIGQTVGKLLRFTPRRTQPEPISLAGPVEDSLALVAHRARALGVELVLTVGAERGEAALGALRAMPPILGEANELGQAVLNLLANALDAFESVPAAEAKAAAPAPRVDISVERRGQQLHLVVADNGPGLAEELLARAPDLFFTTDDSGRGSGLGLAIVHQVAADHGGEVRLASSPGAGFRVEVRLPLAGAADGEQPTRIVTDGTARDAGQTGGTV
jgi:signal transduction histidine kinase